MTEQVRTLVLKLIGDVGYLLDEVEPVSGGSGEVEEYMVSVETIDDLRQAFVALKKEAV
ncbi:MAG: hypothetical protein ACI8PB_004960 [Desulforhopalus sp.]|jgi:hypothetical protein